VIPNGNGSGAVQWILVNQNFLSFSVLWRDILAELVIVLGAVLTQVYLSGSLSVVFGKELLP